jgi:hypothetical protein
MKGKKGVKSTRKGVVKRKPSGDFGVPNRQASLIRFLGTLENFMSNKELTQTREARMLRDDERK